LAQKQILRSLALTDPRGLRNRLTFQKNLAPRNASGGYGENWQTLCQVRGHIEPRVRPGGESLMADWATAKNLYLALTYWRGDITERMRVILGVVPDNLLSANTDSLISGGFRVFLIMDIPQVTRQDRFMEIFLEEVRN
jgi:head-tail adaptor